jgi:1-acyl-sn-glycerol-3-phosphate acyltransferase
MFINLIIVVFYLVFYLNFFCMILFIPSELLYLINPLGSKKYFSLIKNNLIKSLSLITKIFLFPNIFINSNDIFNEIVENSNKTLLISNHLTELDFLLIPIFTSNMNFTYNDIKVAKKNVGYQIPVFGFFGLLSGDIFLQRNINLDKNKLNKKINFNFMLLYPEGTCFTKQKKLISDKYCDKNNLIKFKYHLYPRMTGLKLILNNNKDIKYLYDITIVYDKIKKNYGPDYNMFYYLINKFEIPNKIFIQVNKYKIDRKNCFDKKMIENIFLSKDEFVKKFDFTSNNFIRISYNYSKGFGSFVFVNLICIFSIYLYIKYNFIKYLYFFQIIMYYLYFYFFV